MKIWLSSLVMCFLFLPAIASAELQDGDIYRMQKVYGPDGDLFTEDISGEPWVNGPNGEKEFLDRSTVGPDGTVYVIEESTDDPNTDGKKHGFSALSVIRKADLPWISLEQRLENLRKAGAPESYIKAVIEGHENPASPAEEDKIEPSLQYHLDRMQPDEEIEVYIQHAAQPPLELPRIDINSETGLPGFTMDAYWAKLDAIEARMIEFEKLQQPIVDFIENSGGYVTGQFWVVNAVSASVTPDLVIRLSKLPDVFIIHSKTEMVTEQSDDDDDEPPPITFSTTREVTQTEYFRRTGWEGQRSSGRSDASRIYVGVIDYTEFNDDHVAFNDDASSSRIHNRFTCHTEGYCEEGVLDPSPWGGQNHATRVAGVVGQDLMDSQDTAIIGESARLDRSGVAAEIQYCFINTGAADLLSIATAIVENVDIVAYSLGGSSGRDCGGLLDMDWCPSVLEARGKDTISLAVNAAYADGIFFAKSAGNRGRSCSCPNQVTAPGNATGSFTVGAYEAFDDDPWSDFSVTGNIYDSIIDDGGLYMPSRSMHGPTCDGASCPVNAGRHKPDLAAPHRQICIPSINFNSGVEAYNCDPEDEENPPFAGTSAAAPAVAGAAAIFKDWYIYTFGQTLANDPGKLFVNLLNFGDRKTHAEFEAEPSQYFSNYFGGGRLRIRLPRSEGMDSPYRWQTGVVTLSDGQEFQKWLGPNGAEQTTLPSTVDFMKLAFWWPETGETTMKANISVYLCHGTTTFICNIVTSDGDQKIHFIRDNVESLFPDLTANKKWFFRIVADGIPSGQTRNVYWTFFWEDLARDDADGPCHGLCGEPDQLLFYR